VGKGLRLAWAVVVRVTVAVEAVVPVGVSEAGAMVQVVLVTAPLQVRDVAALKPPLGVRLRVVEAVLPGETEAVVEESEIVKPGVGGAVAVMVTTIAGVDVEGLKAPATPA
jgi:hypothetical protein